MGDSGFSAADERENTFAGIVRVSNHKSNIILKARIATSALGYGNEIVALVVHVQAQKQQLGASATHSRNSTVLLACPQLRRSFFSFGRNSQFLRVVFLLLYYLRQSILLI